MSLLTWSDARPWAKAIKEEVLARRMPPWPAVRGYGAFANDPSLSPFEIDLMAAWADGGAPKGDERDAPAPAAVTPTVPKAPQTARFEVQCGASRPLPNVVLAALRPESDVPLDSMGVTLRAPGAAPKILLLVRGSKPDRPQTYWLASPERVPRGATLHVASPARDCRVAVLVFR
jgi:hypothetical protein